MRANGEASRAQSRAGRDRPEHRELDRISQAIQRATLAELDTLDGKGDLATHILGGTLRGIQCVALDLRQIEALGLEATE